MLLITKTFIMNTAANTVNFCHHTNNRVNTTETVLHILHLTKANLQTDSNEMCHFLANVIFIAFVGVILKPCRASLAAVD